MKSYVVDASVVIKWFVPEIYTEQAVSLLQAESELHAPDLLVPEFGNILWKKVQRREISVQEAEESIQIFQKIPVMTYSTRDLVEKSLEMAIRLKETVYDSLYLALAETLSCPLVTADRVLFEKVKKHKKAKYICWIEDLKQ